MVNQMKLAGFEPVLLHVPGLTEAIDRAWSLDDYVEWLNQELKNENQPIIIAHSNGGRIALAFCAKYPGKVGKLVLVDAAGIYNNELRLRIKRKIFGTIARIGRKFTDSDTLRKVLYKIVGENDYKNANPIMRKTMENLLKVDLTAELEKITAPTLIIWGRKDKATPLAGGRLINEKIKGSEIFVIKDAGHSPHFTHAEEVSQKIIDFIKIH